MAKYTYGPFSTQIEVETPREMQEKLEQSQEKWAAKPNWDKDLFTPKIPGIAPEAEVIDYLKKEHEKKRLSKQMRRWAEEQIWVK